MWVFLGDLNDVRFTCQMFNSSFYRYATEDFNWFIVEAGLVEFNQGGRKYTYMRDDGLK